MENTNKDSSNQANNDYIKMDWSLQMPEERVQKIKEIIENTPSEKLTPNYLEKMADYIVFAMDKQERLKERKIITENRSFTVNKRETSYEGLISKLENGED
jgi:ribosome-interacting GTPase 1